MNADNRRSVNLVQLLDLLDAPRATPPRPAPPGPVARRYTYTDAVPVDLVAEYYRVGKRRAVMSGLRLTRSTAARWIRLARESGAL